MLLYYAEIIHIYVIVYHNSTSKSTTNGSPTSNTLYAYRWYQDIELILSTIPIAHRTVTAIFSSSTGANHFGFLQLNCHPCKCNPAMSCSIKQIALRRYSSEPNLSFHVSPSRTHSHFTLFGAGRERSTFGKIKTQPQRRAVKRMLGK